MRNHLGKYCLLLEYLLLLLCQWLLQRLYLEIIVQVPHVRACVWEVAQVIAKVNAKEAVKGTVRLIVPNSVVLAVAKPVKADAMQNALLTVYLGAKINVSLHAEEHALWVVKVLVVGDVVAVVAILVVAVAVLIVAELVRVLVATDVPEGA